MNEAEVKRRIVASIHEEGGYARRIEDQFSVGMPDLVLMPLRCPVLWAEVKIVKGKQFGPTPRQFIELKRLYRAPYSIPMLIGWKDGIHYVAAPKQMVKLDECDQQKPDESIGDLLRRAVNHI